MFRIIVFKNQRYQKFHLLSWQNQQNWLNEFPAFKNFSILVKSILLYSGLPGRPIRTLSTRSANVVLSNLAYQSLVRRTSNLLFGSFNWVRQCRKAISSFNLTHRAIRNRLTTLYKTRVYGFTPYCRAKLTPKHIFFLRIQLILKMSIN